MKTIEHYEKLETTKLQKLLKKFEKLSEINEVNIDMAKDDGVYYDDLQKENDDYEIDISLLRIELSKRLWFNK